MLKSIQYQIRIIFLTTFLLFNYSSATLAADFQRGSNAYDNGDYTTAMKEWSPLAEGGDALAQFSIGRLFDHGLGFPVDYALAAKWYILAAVQGHAEAQIALAHMYTGDGGVLEDQAEATKWYRLASEKVMHLHKIFLVFNMKLVVV